MTRSAAHNDDLDERIEQTRRYYERDLEEHTRPEPEQKNPAMQLLVFIFWLGLCGGWPLVKRFLSFIFWPLF